MISKLWTTPTLTHISYSVHDDGSRFLHTEAGIHRLFAYEAVPGSGIWRLQLSNETDMELRWRFDERTGDLFATLESMAQALGDENFGDVE